MPTSSSSPIYMLGDLAKGRDNNLNLIRLLAAIAVLFGHSFALLRMPEPLGQTLHRSIGTIAVDVFFIASGFLVGGSLLQRQNLFDYFSARILRIFPALWVMLLITVFVLCPFVTRMDLASYFGDAQVYYYFLKCATLVTDVAYFLPGVFEQNPFRGAVNGSLWTLVYEISMYVLLAVAWQVFAIAKQYCRNLISFTLAVMILGFGTLALIELNRLSASEFYHLFWMFFSGTMFYLFRNRIRLSATYFVAAIGILIASAWAGLERDPLVFQVPYFLLIAYLLFYLAFVPGGLIRQYNRAGDYSYGVYIFAFPIQQALIAYVPNISVWVLTLFASLLTLLMACFSWHLIEKPAMGCRHKILSFFTKDG